MLTLRPAGERGRSDFGWLDSRHSFSFGGFVDPRHMGFRSLRVINDDRVVGGAGFGRHPHRDMEIFSYVLTGTLAHKDSLGTEGTVEAGEVQKMSAGTGILHSEFNASPDRPLRFLQVWILPERPGVPPSYEQRRFPPEDKRGRLKLIGSRDGRDGSIRFQQDVAVYASVLAAGETVRLPVAPGRGAWVQVATGSVEVNGVALAEGDGASVEGEPVVTVTGVSSSEVLLFDLA